MKGQVIFGLFIFCLIFTSGAAQCGNGALGSSCLEANECLSGFCPLGTCANAPGQQSGLCGGQTCAAGEQCQYPDAFCGITGCLTGRAVCIQCS